MSQVVVPDIGDFKDVEVIEVLVKPGDAVSKEQSLITLESDKATMEIPSPADGVVKALKVKTGDKVSQGTPILELDAQENPKAGEKKAEAKYRNEAPNDVSCESGGCCAGSRRCGAGAAPGAARAAGGNDGQASCEPVGAQVRARARRRSDEGARQRAEGPHPACRRAGLREEHAARRPRPGARGLERRRRAAL